MPSFFTFKRNRCLNCGKKLPLDWKKLFCKNCEPKELTTPPPAIEQHPRVEVLDSGEYLPGDLVEDTIANMEEGMVFYTVPWAMFADPDRRLFIVGTYSLEKEPGGTVHLRIIKKNGEILVDKSSVGDHRYSPSIPCYMGVSDSDYIPVKLVNHF